MTVSEGFLANMCDLVAPMGAISVRRMFGGAAVYCDGQIFAVLHDDTLYLKTDAETRALFLAEACGPFVYVSRHGKQVMPAYHRAPDRLLDEPDDLLDWSRAALGAGRRATRAATRSAARPARKTPLPRQAR